MFDIYAKISTTKELWKMLEKEYGTEDVGTKNKQ